MIRWNDNVVKYSLLVAGEPLDIEQIESCLKDGIKMIWFGKDEDCAALKARFPRYVDAFFLSAFKICSEIRLTLIDGIGIKENSALLERLSKEAPAFNLEQYEVEHDGDSPLVVVKAGAGSGKTFVMNNRLLYLLHTKADFCFSDVVMVTFTNRATDEMRRKLIQLLNKKLLITGNIKYLKWIEDVSQISISTIHSFLRRVIIEIGPLLGYGTNLRMTSMTMEKRRILRDILDQRFGDRTDNVSNILGLPLYDIERLAMLFWKKIDNNGMSEYDVFSMDWGPTRSPKESRIQDSLRQIFEEVEERYASRKLEQNAIAMGDIIHEFSRVVNDPRIKEYITNKYKYMFCDEFQDSDDVQIQTISVLDKIYDGNLFVVGDVKQSIYRFRGATDSAFERLKDNIRHEFGEGHICEPYSLTMNYRTAETIMQEIDKIFRTWGDKGYLQYKYTGPDNDVLTPQFKGPGIYKQIKIFRYTELESKFHDLLEQIDKRIGDKKKTIMVLTRNNWQLQEVKKWCKAKDRECLIHERGSFFRSPAVTEFCALTEALLYHSEPMYLFNFLRTAYCYRTIDTENLAAMSGSKYRVLCYFTELIEERFRWKPVMDDLRNRPAMSVLCELISELRPSVTYGAIQKHNYLSAGKDIGYATKQAIIEAMQYEADLQKLLQMLASSFSGDFSSIVDISNYLRNRINTDTEEESAEVSDIDSFNYIQGSTVHSAKGLEFDYVLMPFMNDKFVNDSRSEILIDKEKRRVGWQYKKDPTDPGLHNEHYGVLRADEIREVICDETRLLYVAMTRSIEGLFCFTWWKRNSGEAQTWSDLLPEEYDDADYL